MDIIKSKIKHSLDIEKYFPKENICFLDIETTGLNRYRDVIYLIGVLYFDSMENTWMLKQYFANKLDEEREVLKELSSYISSFDKIVTYNGDNFDLPFIHHRLKRYKLQSPLKDIGSYDIYQYIRKYRFLFDLPNLKLKTIERELGFFREDKYSGLDCINFYFEYMESNNPILKDNILKHNYDDLAHMLDIIPIIDLIDSKKSLCLDLKEGSKILSIERIQVSKDLLTIEGTINPPLENNIKYYDTSFNLLTEDKRIFSLSLEYKLGLITREEKCKFIDLREMGGLGNLRNSEEFNLPPNIFVLAVENKYCIENIKNLLSSVIKSLTK